jgi:hypothetical protein
MEEIYRLRESNKYKYKGRNVIGLRLIDDWIDNLEIGNVMQLNPMTPNELTQPLTKHHEFNKDPLLEKLVLLTVSYFTIATEMRLQAKEDK